MKIETKFNIGDSVWFAEDGAIINGEIINFTIVVFNDHNIQVRYNILGGLKEVNEKFVYSKKQALLTQLH